MNDRFRNLNRPAVFDLVRALYKGKAQVVSLDWTSLSGGRAVLSDRRRVPFYVGIDDKDRTYVDVDRKRRLLRT